MKKEGIEVNYIIIFYTLNLGLSVKIKNYFQIS